MTEAAPASPTWRRRLGWGALGLAVGFVAGTTVALLALRPLGPHVATFLYRLLVYSLVVAGLDCGGERSLAPRALRRGALFGMGYATLRAM